MKSTSSGTAKQVFGKALDRPPAERAAFLESACGSDAALRGEVESLLAAFDAADEFLFSDNESPFPTGSSVSGGLPDAAAARIGRPEVALSAATRASDVRPLEGPGSMVGRYKLLQEIGHGGFGTVFMAEQRDPVVRKVALKVIKLGMDTRQVIARFSAERQALAMMEHPNIAKVLDAGATDTGRPYFVMELVRGDPITAHCDQHQLSIQDRLELFMQVCHAVQHAHTKGVIHRDIKPSNVLVTIGDDKPIPKVIDFGIAKATQTRLTEHTLFTEFRALVGTPAYMSPEQAEMSGVDIDTRSDVYSLGVLLYELLTGTTPFDSRTLLEAGQDEMRRIIREVEPPRPSTRLSSLGEHGRLARADAAVASGPAPSSAMDIARHRRSDPPSLSRALRGDLDWIVMKCLEKDRSRRYETANGLASDIRRNLTGEPVLAAPPGAGYRVRKFIRRHKVGVAAGMAIAGVLLLGIAGTTGGMLWALREQGRAEQQKQVAEDNEQKARLEAAKTRAATDFLWKMFGSADPAQARGQDVTVREVLDKASATVEADLADQPEVQAQVRAMIGATYVGLGMGESAIPHLEYALESGRRLLGNEQEWTLWVMGQLRQAYHLAGENEKCLQICEEQYQTLLRLRGEDHPETVGEMSNLGNTYVNLGEYAKAEPLLIRAKELAMRVFRKDHWGYTSAHANLGNLYRRLGRWNEAEQVLVESLGQSSVSPQYAVRFQHELAGVYQQQERLDKAEETARGAVDKGMAILGGEHPETIAAMQVLAGILSFKGATAEAEDLHRKAIEAAREIASPRRREYCESLAVYAGFLERAGRPSEAEQQILAMLDVLRKVRGDDDLSTLDAQVWLTHLAGMQGAADRARGYQASQMEPRSRLLLSSKPTASNLNSYAMALITVEPPEYREPAAALQFAERAVELSGRQNPSILDTLAQAYLLAGEFDRSRQAYEEIVNVILTGTTETGPALEHEVLEGLRNLIDALQQNGDQPAVLENVCALAERAGRLLVARRQAGRHEMLDIAQSYLAFLLTNCGRFAEAEPMIREVLEHRKTSLPPHHWLIGNSMSLLGESLYRQGKFVEAEPLLIEGYERIMADPQALRHRRPEAMRRNIQFYEAWHAAEPGRGYDAKAAEWRDKLAAWQAAGQPATSTP